jgi:hypothetical protein
MALGPPYQQEDPFFRSAAFLINRRTTAEHYILPAPYLSGFFDSRVLLCSEILVQAARCNAFRPVDGADDVPGLLS